MYRLLTPAIHLANSFFCRGSGYEKEGKGGERREQTRQEEEQKEPSANVNHNIEAGVRSSVFLMNLSLG